MLKQVFAVALVPAALALVLLAPGPAGAPPILSVAAAADKSPTATELQKQIVDLQGKLKVAEGRAEFFKTLAENQKAQLAAQGAALSVASTASVFSAAHNELAKQLGCPDKGLVMDPKTDEPACPPKPDPEEEKRKEAVRAADLATRQAGEAAASEAERERRQSPPATKQR